MVNPVFDTVPEADIPLDFQAAFDDATSSPDSDLQASIKLIGTLKLPSGKIVASDPLVYYAAEPLAASVKPGEYPVSILVVQQNTRTGSRIDRYALAKLQISDQPAVRWFLATTGSQNPADLEPDEMFGYTVDTGLGSFCDASTFAEYARFTDSFHNDNPDKNIYDDHLAELFKQNAKHPTDTDDPEDIGDWLDFVVPESDGNIIMFHSGWGDGFYASYWGIDQSGTICCLVTDFQVLGNND